MRTKSAVIKITNRTALYLLLFLAPIVWAGLLLFTRFVPPQSALAFVAFFILLTVALTSTLSPLAYFIGLSFISSRLYQATVRHSLRQGTLLSLCVVFNLILRAFQSWNPFMAILIFGAALIIEVLSLARK